MPDFDEVFSFDIRPRSRSRSVMPLDNTVAPLNTPNIPSGFTFLAPVAGVLTAYFESPDFWQIYAQTARRPNPPTEQLSIIEVPYRFRQEGFIVNAETQIRALPDTGKMRVTIPTALSDRSSLVITLDLEIRRTEANAKFFNVVGYADNHGSDTGEDSLGNPIDNSGKGLTLETLDGDTWRPVLPTVQPAAGIQRWGKVVGTDVAFGTVTVDGEAFAVTSQRSLRVRVARDETLVQIGTAMIRGTDSNGIPIRWRVNGVEYLEDTEEMILNTWAYVT